MKIRSIEKLQDLLDNDLAWRKKELIDIQLMIHSTRNKTICRMGLALLCAHFEGFIKQTANYYILYISCQNLKISELKVNFMAIFSYGKLSMCSETNKISVYSRTLKDIFDAQDNYNFHIHYSQDNPIIKTGGNPSSKVFREIVESIGLDFAIYETKQNYIDTDLLSNRHSIVHGERIFVSENDFDETLKNIIAIMYAFKEQILNAALDKDYLKAKVSEDNEQYE